MKPTSDQARIPRAQEIFFITLIAIVGVLSFLVFQPYLYSLLLALIIAIAVEPVHRHLMRVFHNHQNTATISTVFFVILVVAVPVGFFGWKIVQEAQGLYISLSNTSSASIIDSITTIIPESLRQFVPELSETINTYIQNALSFVVQNIGSVFSGVVTIVGDILIALLSLFFILKHKSSLVQLVKRISPLPDEYDSLIIARVQGGVNAVVRGTLAVAIAQGIIASIGFALFGVPTPVIWGALAMLASLIPTIGTTLITAPAIAYLFLTGHIVPAIGLLVWAVVAVGLIDNALSPFLINRGLKLHPLIVLLAVLGGLIFFGPLGFILGPVVIALFVALLEIYAHLHKQDPFL
jgi:predicted PurR-regulated permease PerM